MSRVVKLDTIVVPLSELLEQLELMRDDGMDVVELSIAPPEMDMGQQFPARLDLSAASLHEASALVDYDSIDAADIDPNVLGQELD